MGSFKDVVNSPQGWIHELARGELHPEADRILNIGKSFDPQQLVEESTIQFLSELREVFTRYASVFNALSEGGAKYPEIKLYNIAAAAADFMIYRNQMKLVVSNSAHGVIQLAFAQHIASNLSVNGSSAPTSLPGSGMAPSLQQPQELTAQIGPFRDVHWTFQGVRVTTEQVGRFYFAEFVRASRDLKRLRNGLGSVQSNQALIEQIKALLDEKGLHL